MCVTLNQIVLTVQMRPNVETVLLTKVGVIGETSVLAHLGLSEQGKKQYWNIYIYICPLMTVFLICKYQIMYCFLHYSAGLLNWTLSYQAQSLPIYLLSQYDWTIVIFVVLIYSNASYSDYSGTLTLPADHTRNRTSNYYMFVDFQQGGQYQLATMQSPTLRKSAPSCMLSFYYYLIGTSRAGLIQVQDLYIFRSVYDLFWEK